MLQHLKQSDVDEIIAVSESTSGGAAAVPGEISSADRDRVYGLIEALPREAQDELLALMWTGGPKNESTFAENLELAQKTSTDNPAEHVAEQVAHLAGYLRAGLQRLSAE